MNVNEKLVQAKGMESNVQLIAMLLLKLLAADEALAKGFTRDAFTWEEMEKYVNDKALSARNEKKPHAKVMCISPETVMGWVKEFFLLDELPQKPEIPKPTPPKKTTAVKKRGASAAPASTELPLHESDAREEDEEDETDPVCQLPVLSKEGGEEKDEHDATAALKKQISLFEMA